MAGLLITGTGTDVGKTYVTAALIRALRARGCLVDALKPVVSGFDPAAPEGSDPAVLLEALGIRRSPEALERLSPWRFAAPLSPPLAAQREGRRLDADAVTRLCQARLAASTDHLLLIEGAGGVMSPLDDRRTMLDLFVNLQLPVVLVAGSYVGTVSHTLTALLALRSATLEVAAVVVSENEDAPPLTETLDALQAHIPGTAVFALARNAQAPAGVVQRIIDQVWPAPSRGSPSPAGRGPPE